VTTAPDGCSKVKSISYPVLYADLFVTQIMGQNLDDLKFCLKDLAFGPFKSMAMPIDNSLNTSTPASKLTPKG
jgi:hypothetical protein